MKMLAGLAKARHCDSARKPMLRACWPSVRIAARSLRGSFPSRSSTWQPPAACWLAARRAAQSWWPSSQELAGARPRGSVQSSAGLLRDGYLVLPACPEMGARASSPRPSSWWPSSPRTRRRSSFARSAACEALLAYCTMGGTELAARAFEQRRHGARRVGLRIDGRARPRL